MFSYILCIIRPYWHLQFIVLMPVFILKYKQMAFLFFLSEFPCSLVEHLIMHVNYVILSTLHQYLTSAQNLDNDFILWIYHQKFHGGIMWWSVLNFSGKPHAVFLNGYAKLHSHWGQGCPFSSTLLNTSCLLSC